MSPKQRSESCPVHAHVPAWRRIASGSRHTRNFPLTGAPRYHGQSPFPHAGPIMSLQPETRQHIESMLAEHPVVLFMKGNPQTPMCGFSAAASAALNDLAPGFFSVDVLADQDIREGIKEFGDWPTIPQLYVKGELVGGADIIKQMYASGELHRLLGVPEPDRTPPEITITDAAAEKIRANLPDDGDGVLHLALDGHGQAGFSLAPATPHDIVSSANGIEVHFDPGAAQRARGVVIDWVKTMQGEGLTLSFPGSATVKSMTVEELKQRMDAGGITLVDVRPPEDRARAVLPMATALEDIGEASLAELPKDTPLAFLCHHGNSSMAVAQQFAAHGFSDVYNVEGGINAWSERIDSSVPRY